MPLVWTTPVSSGSAKTRNVRKPENPYEAKKPTIAGPGSAIVIAARADAPRHPR